MKLGKVVFDEEPLEMLDIFYGSDCGNGGHRCPSTNSLYKELKSHKCLYRVILKYHG